MTAQLARHCAHINQGRAFCCMCRTWSPRGAEVKTAAKHHETTGRWA